MVFQFQQSTTIYGSQLIMFHVMLLIPNVFYIEHQKPIGQITNLFTLHTNCQTMSPI
jgi:hypothetical protein